MPVNPFDLAAMTPLPTGPVRWFLTSISPTYQNEGAKVNARVIVYNPVPGATVEIEVTGALAGGDDWIEDWHVVATAACLLRGCTYERLPGATKGRITLGADYVSGSPIDITRTSRLDERTEGTQQFDCFIRNPSQGIIARGVVSRWLYDVSLTPPGTPTFRFVSITPGTGVDEGGSFTLRLLTENMAGKELMLRLYTGNTASGQADWTEAFTTTLRAAALAAGCQFSMRQNPGYDAAAGFETPGTGGLNGAIIRFVPGQYDDANPITFTRTALSDNLTEDAQEQVDFLIDKITGPENLIVYSTVVTKWVRDTSQSPTPSYWQITSTLAGGVVTYSLFSETGTSAGAVTIAQLGDAADSDFVTGFYAALQAAADADSHVSYDGAGRVTVDAGWGGAFVWSRALTPDFASRRLHAVRLSAPSDPTRIVVADAVLFLGGATLPAWPAFLTGVNLAGGEFGSGTTIPGAYGTDYRYPARPEFNVLTSAAIAAGMDLDDYRHQELFYWWQKGAGVIRLPVRWERIQRELFGPLYDGGFTGTWNAGSSFDMARIDDVIRYAMKRGIRVILDVHNYARYRIPGVSADLIGPASSPSPEAYYDVLRKLALRYMDRQGWVGIDIMNEPGHTIAKDWARFARGAVQAIRSTGFTGRVLVPGVAASGGWSWLSSGNADALSTLVDPAGNMDFTPHQYLNADRSGAGTDAGQCTLNSGFQLRSMIAWCREVPGRTLLLGEFGVSDPAVTGQEQCSVELPNMLQLLNTSRDVVRGWTAWVGGQRTNPTDPFFLGPQNAIPPVDTPQAQRLIPYLYDGGD
jgi:endoglucanase